MCSKPVLGYWNIRGLGQPIRYLLAHAGVDFIDKRYNFGPAPDFDRAEWLKEKFELGLDFPNLPYYFDGDVKLTQTLAIMRYIGLKYNLDGNNDQDKNRIAMLEQQVVDLDNQLVKVSYHPDCDEQMKKDFCKILPNLLKSLSDFLAERKFVCGDQITYVDFWLYEYLRKMTVFVSNSLGNFENLQKFLESIESLPNVKQFMKTDKPGLFHSPNCKWNESY